MTDRPGPGDDRRRRKDDAPSPQGPVDAPAPATDDAATWGGEGGGGHYRGGPTTSPGDAARDPDGNPEVM